MNSRAGERPHFPPSSGDHGLFNVVGGRWADVSDCGLYRYELGRRWNAGPLLEFIMLNPSTADATVDDATIRRIVGSKDTPGFARRWGYGAVVVRNLFAYRSTHPSVLLNVDDPVGPKNRDYLSRADADCTVVAWGANNAAVGWWNGYPFKGQRTVIDRPALHCLGFNANGSPKHPLYVPTDQEPMVWRPSPKLPGREDVHRNGPGSLP